MTAPQTGPQGRRTDHPSPDPLVMSPGEKVAAEWEARHDVAARGHRAAPGAVQHYLAESRAHEARHTGATRAAHAGQPSDRATAPEPVARDEARPAAPPARRRWRLFGRRG